MCMLSVPYRKEQVVRHSRRLGLREGAVQLEQTVEKVGPRHEVHLQDLVRIGYVGIFFPFQ